MTIQEEIKEALARELRDLRGRDYNEDWAAEWIMGILATLGVVIKVDRPFVEPTPEVVAVESLIKGM